MKSKLTGGFRKQYSKLPPATKRRARRAYLLWKRDPNSAGLYFKRVSVNLPVYSVRIGLDYRALGVSKGDTITWYWIGQHDEYERLIQS